MRILLKSDDCFIKYLPPLAVTGKSVVTSEDLFDGVFLGGKGVKVAALEADFLIVAFNFRLTSLNLVHIWIGVTLGFEHGGIFWGRAVSLHNLALRWVADVVEVLKWPLSVSDVGLLECSYFVILFCDQFTFLVLDCEYEWKSICSGTRSWSILTNTLPLFN